MSSNRQSSSSSEGSASATQECGYDLNFEPELDAKYKCPVCLVAMKNAVQTKCGHRFCKTCLKQSNGNTRYARCPVDNTWYDTTRDIFADAAAQREILSLTVLCENKPKGCLWRGELRDIKDHNAQCPEAEVQCPNKCDQSEGLKRRDLGDHRAVCLKRLETCPYCTSSIIAADLTKHQLLVCNKFPVNCGMCGETGIIREAVKHHVDPAVGNCPFVTIKCAFEYVGCHFQDKRQKMSLHYEHACHQHMIFLCSKLAEHDEKLNLQQRQLDTVSCQYAALREISTKQDRLIEEQGQFLAEQAVRIQELETCKFDGLLIWKLQLKDPQGRRTSDRFHSPAMYTGRPGYKLSCTLKLDDPKSGLSCLSVQLSTGAYDDQLPFPFNGKCSITVHDQSDTNKHRKFIIRCQGLMQRPVTSTNQDAYSSRTEFLPTDELMGSTYSKNGTVYVKIAITDKEDLPELFDSSLQFSQ